MLMPRFKLRFAVNVYVLALMLVRACVRVRVRGVRSNHMQPFRPFSKFFRTNLEDI